MVANNNHNQLQQQINQLLQNNLHNQPPIHNQIHLVAPKQPIINQRSARGLLTALSGLSNVATRTNLLVSKDPDMDSNGGSSGVVTASSSSSNGNKLKPYAFNDVEMSAIQAMISLRNIIGDLLHKFGVNIPSSLASLITRSEVSSVANSGNSETAANALSSLLSSASSKVNAALILRGLALSLPLLIPMANQLRRMSTENNPVFVPSSGTSMPLSSQASMQSMMPPLLPHFDPYGYDRAAHRRRGKRSAPMFSTTYSTNNAGAEDTLLSPNINRLLKYSEQQRILSYLRQLNEIYGIGNTAIESINNQPQMIQRRRRRSASRTDSSLH